MTGCILCLPSKKIFNRDIYAIELLPEMKMIRDGVLVDYRCPSCDSRLRNRTLSKLMHFMEDFFAREPRRLLLVSSPKKERNIVSQYSSDVIHISLHGNFGDKGCIEGIDLCCIDNIPEDSFDMAIACCVLDYIPDLKKVFVEQNRILKKDGRFVFFIMPFRLTGIDGCRIKHNNALAHEVYAQSGNSETGIPDCEFSIDWIIEQASLSGFELLQVLMSDDISGLTDRWFVAQKIR